MVLDGSNTLLLLTFLMGAVAVTVAALTNTPLLFDLCLTVLGDARQASCKGT
jgi:hypothetical protein